MTADRSTCPALFIVPSSSSRRSDPVRDRVSGGHALTNSQTFDGSPEHSFESGPAARGLHLAEVRSTGPRGPHPGDVLYWVACLGGACLLLLSATT